MDEAIVYTEMSCFHTEGAIGSLSLETGKVIAEDGGIVYLVKAQDASTTAVEEVGTGKFIIPSEITTTDVNPEVVEGIGYTSNTITTEYTYDNSARSNSAYEISTLAQLETFRDLVNGGFSFNGTTVELTADIKLDDGWTPIGEGARQVGATKYPGDYAGTDASAFVFKGTFNGNGHTIDNLNNKGYYPSHTYDDSGVHAYCYGFFGILNGATVTNLNFTNVNISYEYGTTDKSGLKTTIDTCGALVGFIDGASTLSDIHVLSGTIKTYAHNSATGGVIGRWYRLAESISLVNITNNAKVTSDEGETTKGCRAAGLIGYASFATNGKVTFDNCNNSNNISSTAVADNYAVGEASAFVINTNCQASGKISSTKGEGSSAQSAIWSTIK